MNPMDESVLKGFKYFKPLWPILKKLPPEDSHPPRQLHDDQYLCLILFYFFNPTLTGLRSIQKASQLEKVQNVLGVKSTSLTPPYAGMSYPRLEEKGLCWPCPTPDHPGTPYLHKDRFSRGKGMFHGIDFRPPAETPDNDYPFWLTTGTIFSQYLTGTMTRRCPSLHHENSEVFIQIHPDDAARLQIYPGEEVKASTRRGGITAKAWITERVKPGVVFIPMHFMENAANRLTNAALDSITKTPEYKVCAVRLEKPA